MSRICWATASAFNGVFAVAELVQTPSDCGECMGNLSRASNPRSVDAHLGGKPFLKVGATRTGATKPGTKLSPIDSNDSRPKLAHPALGSRSKACMSEVPCMKTDVQCSLVGMWRRWTSASSPHGPPRSPHPNKHTLQSPRREAGLGTTWGKWTQHGNLDGDGRMSGMYTWQSSVGVVVSLYKKNLHLCRQQPVASYFRVTCC